MNSNNRRARTTARKTILAIAAALLLSASLPVFAQEPACKSKSGEVKVNYPELARRMKIYGVVRLQLQLSAAGRYESPRFLAGTPCSPVQPAGCKKRSF